MEVTNTPKPAIDEALELQIAGWLDHPSVYMGGPSKASRRTARRMIDDPEIVRGFAALTAAAQNAPKAEPVDGDALTAAINAYDEARMRAHGHPVSDLHAMSATNKNSIRPMIAAACTAFIAARYQQEPDAWKYRYPNGDIASRMWTVSLTEPDSEANGVEIQPLYASPPDADARLRAEAARIVAAYDKANAEPLVALANYGELALQVCRLLAAKPEAAADAGLRSEIERLKRIADAAEELLEVANLRGDNVYLDPCDDPLTWTARRNDAWGELEDALAANPKAVADEKEG